MIELPFPPSILSGHSKGSHWPKTKATKQWRMWAFHAALEAKPEVPAEGDIIVRVHFVPPDRRSDRTNFANRMKPIFDGLADALKVNDRRFLPEYSYAEPEQPGRVEITILNPCNLCTKSLDASVSGESRAIEEPDRAALEAPLPALTTTACATRHRD